jgi:hypothetical protein
MSTTGEVGCSLPRDGTREAGRLCVEHPRYAHATRLKCLTSFPYPLDSRVLYKISRLYFDPQCADRRTPSTAHDNCLR